MKPNVCRCGHWVEDHREFHGEHLNHCAGEMNAMCVCDCKEFIEEIPESERFRRAAALVLPYLDFSFRGYPELTLMDIVLKVPDQPHVHIAHAFDPNDITLANCDSIGTKLKMATMTLAASAENGWKQP